MNRLLQYNEWANARVFDSIATLTDEQRTKDLGSSFPSVLLTAAHIVGAEWVWLGRWVNAAPSAFPEWVTRPEWVDLRRRLKDVEDRRAAFLRGLTDADLAVKRPFKLLNGNEDSQPIDVMITHVVTHSSYHRGQLAGMFRQLGLKPVGSDYIVFAREK